MANREPPSGPGLIDRDAEAICTAFYDSAYQLEGIREHWREGDARIVELLRSCDAASSGYEQIVRHGYRAGIAHTLSRRLDRDMLPLILPHCDPSLRDRVQALRDKLELDVIQETDDEPATRWRLQWGRLGLDRELDGVAAGLRARGDAIRLQGIAGLDGGVTHPQGVPAASVPPRPEPVAHVIDALNMVTVKAQCLAAGIEGGQRRQWHTGEPKRWKLLPPRADYVAAERQRIETAGVQVWNASLEGKAVAAWEDQCEANRERERDISDYLQWREVMLAEWTELDHWVKQADAAVRKLGPYLRGVRSNPEDWVNDTLQSLGYLEALRPRWGERPWVGDTADLLGPLQELLNRMSFLQRAEFGRHNDSSDGRVMRQAKWFDAVTSGQLNAPRLSTARSRSHLKDHRKQNGRWFYEVHEVCRHWPEYGPRLRARLAKEGDSETLETEQN